MAIYADFIKDFSITIRIDNNNYDPYFSFSLLIQYVMD